MTHTENRRKYASLSVVAVLALAGCGTRAGHSEPRSITTMGGMGVGGYRYAPLSCSAPTRLPGTVVTVTLADMGMSRMMTGIAPMGTHMMLSASATTVAAGPISFIGENLGWRTHELVVLPLAIGSVAGTRTPGPDGTVDETGNLGEASADCAAGIGNGIPSGALGWVTVVLVPGHYELVCDLPNQYADGMRQELTVTP